MHWARLKKCKGESGPLFTQTCPTSRPACLLFFVLFLHPLVCVRARSLLSHITPGPVLAPSRVLYACP